MYLNRIPFYETEALIEYLSDMSAKGKFFTKYDSKISFDKDEPKRLYYYIGYFKPDDTRTIGDYVNSVESAGWSFIYHNINDDMFFFSSENQIPYPIEKNNSVKVEKLEKLRKSERKSLFFNFFLLLFLVSALIISRPNLDFYTISIICLVFLWFIFSLYNLYRYSVNIDRCYLNIKKISYKKLLIIDYIFDFSYVLLLILVIIRLFNLSHH